MPQPPSPNEDDNNGFDHEERGKGDRGRSQRSSNSRPHRPSVVELGGVWCMSHAEIVRGREGCGPKGQNWLWKYLHLPSPKSAPNAFILVPTREICQQVYNEASSLLEFRMSKLKVVQVNASTSDKDIIDIFWLALSYRRHRHLFGFIVLISHQTLPVTLEPRINIFLEHE
ncbi:hypothetical protein GUJ93_ZPchr0002g24725 [Zizania palustris]|uniref:DEAD/DEAH box helicase domain-containing protein n=1 Tax=Zizania palustris TaxID=103762 RepID=A0A8J5S1D9_ZIZPA|nr:hypothetical protein GUJ93_ZPchr0002g24725 [Zizania palustris]